MARARHRQAQPFRLSRRRLLGEPLEDRRLLAVTTNLAPLSGLAVDSAEHSTSSLIVQFRPGTNAVSSLAAYVATSKVDDQWSLTPGMHKVELNTDADWAAALVAFRQDANVQFVEPDYRVSLQLEPNDPDYGQTWGLNNTGQTDGFEDADIDAPEAWDKTTGSTKTIVAVIDTGVDYNHPDLYENIWINQGEIPASRSANLVDIDGDGLITFRDLNDEQNEGPGKITDINADGRIDGSDLLAKMQKSGGQDTGLGGWADSSDSDHNGQVDDLVGYNFVGHTNDPMDDHFHGTHVSGTIGAMGDNGVGVAGVNWQVEIMPLKFLDASGGGYESDAINALNYAVANGAVVSNNSWGGGGYSAAFQTAIQNAADKGHIFVAAAGNDGSNNDQYPFYPAGYNVDNVVSVAATDDSDKLAYFSNFGRTTVDLAAPGVNIYSTFPTHLTPAMQQEGLGPDYGTISGTSMATPHVTGVMALVRSLHPDWSYSQVIDQVLGSVDVIDAALQTVSGGRVNAAAAVGNAPPDIVGPRLVTSNPAGNTTGTIAKVRLQFNESIDVTTFTLADIVSLNGPNGSIAVSAVVPVAGNTRQFDVLFLPQTDLGDYSLVIGPDIADLSGNLLDQNRNGTGGEDPDDDATATFTISDAVSYVSPDVPQPIDNLDSLFGQFTESILTVPDDFTISQLKVQLNISYNYDDDLTIVLVSPSGTQVTLSDGNGGEEGGFFDTIFDDDASTPVSLGSAPFSGSYRPDQPLSALNGENARGDWKLQVSAAFNIDHFLDGEGSLDGWSMEINGSGGGGGPPPPPPPGSHLPVAGDDSLQGETNSVLAMTAAQLLANDSDADGDPLSITFVGNPVGGSASLSDGQLITFTPTHDFQGEASFQYIVTDGHLTAVGNVTIDFEPSFQRHNSALAQDVNGDGVVSPVDALYLINTINAFGSGWLVGLNATDTSIQFPDVVPDNYLSPIDALDVINYLNSYPTQSKAVSSASTDAPPTGVDEALLSLLNDPATGRKRI